MVCSDLIAERESKVLVKRVFLRCPGCGFQGGRCHQRCEVNRARQEQTPVSASNTYIYMPESKLEVIQRFVQRSWQPKTKTEHTVASLLHDLRKSTNAS
jgi:hypothetical protein